MKKILSILLFLFCLNLMVADKLPKDREVYSINDQPETKSKLYPNPARDFVYIKNTSNSRLKNISILSIVGSSVISKEITNEDKIQELNVSKLPTGKYFTKISYLDGYMEILTLIKL